MSSVKVQEGELTKFPEEIYVGLQVPKSHPLKKTTKEVIVKKKMTDEEIADKEGKYFDEDDMKIYDEDIDIYTEDDGDKGKKILLAKLRKKVIDPEIIRTGWEGFWITAAPSRNRGAAAGPIAVNGKYWQKRNPQKIQGHSAYDGKMRVNNNVFI